MNLVNARLSEAIFHPGHDIATPGIANLQIDGTAMHGWMKGPAQVSDGRCPNGSRYKAHPQWCDQVPKLVFKGKG
jgi:hypothetical protein